MNIAKFGARRGASIEPREVTGARALPRHIAVIMDGNGRWAKAHGFPRVEGHRRGVEAVRRTLNAARELGIEAVTLYSFSSENWSRPAAEVGELMSLLKRFILSDLNDLHANNVRVRIIGERHPTDSDIQSLLDHAETLTRENTGLCLTVAFNYGARNEIARAARKLAEEVAAGRLDPAQVDADHISDALDTAGLPSLDLVIRTSGEQRLSNFLLWQAAYAELVFLPVLWPDFDREWLERALSEYAGRERRFGGLSPQES